MALDWLLRHTVKNYRDTKDPNVRKRYGILGSLYGLVTNFLLFGFKIVFGAIFGMTSLIADAVDNLSDFGNNLIAIFGIRLASKGPDREHPYGHQRMEYVISLVTGCIIVALGVVLAYQGVRDVIDFFTALAQEGRPSESRLFLGDDRKQTLIILIIVLSLAILVKLTQSLFYFALGKRIDSLELKALGKDSRNDVISTLFVLTGTVVSWFTHYDVDGFFTVAVSLLIILSGASVLKEAGTILLGLKPDEKLIQDMVNYIKKNKSVLGVHDLAMHTYGQDIYAVIHVEVDASRPFLELHEVSDILERQVYGKFHIRLTIHLDPVVLNDPETEKYQKALKAVLESLPEKLSMHDFRIIKGKESVNLVFELVIPSSLDNEESKTKLRKTIRDRLNQHFGKEVFLSVTFDNSAADFLAGTDAETIL